MSFNYRKIKEINFSVNDGVWNSEKYNLVLTLNPVTKSNFIVKFEPVEPEIKDFSEANEILKKYML